MEKCVRLANEAKDRGEIAAAVVKIEACRDQFSDQGFVWWYVGEIYAKQGEDEKTPQRFCDAAAAYEKAADLYGRGSEWGSQAFGLAEKNKGLCPDNPNP